MANIEIAAMTGRKIVLDADVIEQFRAGLRGSHLLRGDDGYDAARKIYNAMIEHRPAIIARCAGAADVISAVNFARKKRPVGVGPRRRPQCVGQRGLRRWADDRPVTNEKRAC
jgi:hypothetical protein